MAVAEWRGGEGSANVEERREGVGDRETLDGLKFQFHERRILKKFFKWREGREWAGNSFGICIMRGFSSEARFFAPSYIRFSYRFVVGNNFSNVKVKRHARGEEIVDKERERERREKSWIS